MHMQALLEVFYESSCSPESNQQRIERSSLDSKLQTFEQNDGSGSTTDLRSQAVLKLAQKGAHVPLEKAICQSNRTMP